MFSATKAAQVASVFAERQGGTINIMKLIKLMYLGDRESLSRYGSPITFDHMVSLDNGPILSQVLNLINGDGARDAAARWQEWFSDRENHDIALKRRVARGDLDQLSDVDLEILGEVWSRFGEMDQWALSDYTHRNCPEWTDPRGSSLQIRDMDILRVLGKSEQEAVALAEAIQAERDLDRVFARL